MMPVTPVMTLSVGMGVSTNDLVGCAKNFIHTAKSPLATLKSSEHRPTAPKRYIGFCWKRSRNFTVTRSAMTLSTRSRPYFELPEVRA